MGNPIIVLGAARSGTKLLRGLIAAAGAREVPYDINYVWRYGQTQGGDDVLEAEDAVPGLGAHVMRQLERLARGDGDRIVEKTVSNVLRIPYVQAALPDARLVYIERRGEDVVESAVRRWQAPPEPGRLWEKLQTFPWSTASGYALRYVRSRLGRRTRGHVATWGPRYRGIDQDVRELTLIDVCARQWVACITAAQRDLPGTALRVRYEDLVRNPPTTMAELTAALDLDLDRARAAARAHVQADRDGYAARMSREIEDIRTALQRAHDEAAELL